MYKLLIFDWDGTLMDSSDRIVSCMQAAAREITYPVPTVEDVRDIIGLSLNEANKRIWPGIGDADNLRMQKLYSKHYSSLDTTQTPLYDNVVESLHRLKNKGYTLAVATGKSRRGLDRVLAQTNLEGVFSVTRGADEALSKPDPLMLRQILQECDLQPSDALMIGDTSYDLEMAQQINMQSIAVSYGMHSVERLKTFNPILVVDSFEQIENWLDLAMEIK